MHPAEGLFALDHCSVHPLPENRVLARNPRNGRQAILTPDVWHALTDCREFRTLAGHADHLATANPALAGQQQHILQVLDKVRGDGLMISASVYTQLLAPSGRQVALQDRPVLAVITWERPEALARCLDSLAANCALEAYARLYVVDDTRTQAVIARNRASTQEFATRSPLPVHYMGASEQAGFMQRIIRNAPALEEPLRFLVDRERWAAHWTSGLARTVALLLSVGERLLVLDDDIVCAAYEPFRAGDGAGFGDTLREAAVFANDGEWAGFRSQGPDPLARHTRVLGLGLADALSAVGLSGLEAEVFAGASASFLERLRPDSPVLLSECGSLGDCGTTTTNWLTSLEGPSLARLLASPESVQAALRVRNHWHGRSRPHVPEYGNMSQLTGLDNRRLLPPYMPVMRGEDRLFGTMLANLHPGGVVLDQAFAVPHLPLPARTWRESDSGFDTRVGFPNFMLDMLADRPLESHAGDPLRRLARVAARFEDLGEMSHRDLTEHWVANRIDVRANHYRRLTTLRAECTAAPQPWLDYLDDALGRLSRELADNPVDPSVRGYPAELADQRLLDWWRDFWPRFGHALRAWPVLRQAAKACREPASSG